MPPPPPVLSPPPPVPPPPPALLGVTVMVTATEAESTAPSFTVKVKASAPTYFEAGGECQGSCRVIQ